MKKNDKKPTDLDSLTVPDQIVILKSNGNNACRDIFSTINHKRTSSKTNNFLDKKSRKRCTYNSHLNFPAQR